MHAITQVLALRYSKARIRTPTDAPFVINQSPHNGFYRDKDWNRKRTNDSFENDFDGVIIEMRKAFEKFGNFQLVHVRLNTSASQVGPSLDNTKSPGNSAALSTTNKKVSAQFTRIWAMPGRSSIQIKLTEPQRRLLDKWSRGSRWRMIRGEVIKRAAQGLSNSMIAEQLGISRNTVRLWRYRFAREGIAGLNTRPIPGRPSKQR